MYYVERYVKRDIHDSVYSLSEVLCLILRETCRSSITGRVVCSQNVSFTVADIKRTLDAMSWAKVCTEVSIFGIVPNSRYPLDQSVPLARRRQSKLPSANTRFHGSSC